MRKMKINGKTKKEKERMWVREMEGMNEKLKLAKKENCC